VENFLRVLVLSDELLTPTLACVIKEIPVIGRDERMTNRSIPVCVCVYQLFSSHP